MESLIRAAKAMLRRRAPETLGVAGADEASEREPTGSAGQQRLPISAFIICKDERRYLGNCIESLAQCEEIVIVDSGSTDGTIELIEEYVSRGWPIRFLHNDWPGYSLQKQFALEQCRQPWRLSLDADERLDPELQASLPELIKAPPTVAGYRLARRPYLIGFGYTPRRSREGKILRLIRRDRGDFDPTLKVHEGIRPIGAVRDARRGSLLHFRPLPIEEQILKENKYSTLKTDMLLERGVRQRPIRMLLNPPMYFLRLYFGYGLWRCGIPGYIQAMTGAVYSFLTESKVYQRQAEQRRPSFDCLEGRLTPPADRDAQPDVPAYAKAA